MSLLSSGWSALTVAYSSGVALQRGWIYVGLDFMLLVRAIIGIWEYYLGAHKAVDSSAITEQLKQRESEIRRYFVFSVTICAIALAACSMADATGVLYACCNRSAPLYPIAHAFIVTLWMCVLCVTVYRGDRLSRLPALPLPAALAALLCAAALAHSTALRRVAQSTDAACLTAPASSDASIAVDALVASLVTYIAIASIVASLAWSDDGDDRTASDVRPPSVNTPATPSAYHLADTTPARATSVLDSASLYSSLTYAYLNPLFRAGLRRQLGMADIDALPSAIRTRDAAARFEHELARLRAAGDLEMQSSPRITLLRLLLRVYGAAWTRLGLLQALNTALSFAGPLVLNKVLSFLTDGGGGAWVGLGWALLMALQALVSAALSARYNFAGLQLQIQLRSGMTAAVVSTALTSPATSAATLSSGAVTNYVSVDVQRLQDAVTSLHQLWALPVQVRYRA